MKPEHRKTNKKLKLHYGWNKKWFTLRKGSIVRKADNLPEGRGFWLVTVPKALKKNEEFLSWHDIYGFLIDPENVAAG